MLYTWWKYIILYNRMQTCSQEFVPSCIHGILNAACQRPALSWDIRVVCANVQISCYMTKCESKVTKWPYISYIYIYISMYLLYICISHITNIWDTWIHIYIYRYIYIHTERYIYIDIYIYICIYISFPHYKFMRYMDIYIYIYICPCTSHISLHHYKCSLPAPSSLELYTVCKYVMVVL